LASERASAEQSRYNRDERPRLDRARGRRGPRAEADQFGVAVTSADDDVEAESITQS